MNSTRYIQCVFYSHVWAIHMLRRAHIGQFEDQVLIELSIESNLAAVFGEQAKPRLGLAGLLRLSGRLEKLVHSFNNIPCPLILAPQPNVALAALCSAVALLPSTPTTYQRITLLVHIDDSALFTHAYSYVDRFCVLWDIADIPTDTLITLAEILTDQHQINPSQWSGFHWYKHPNRPITDAPERIAALQALIAEYPLVTAAA